MPRILSFLMTAALLFAASVSAQQIDATIQLKDRFEGTIASVGDIDVVAFDGLAGELVTLSVSAAKGSSLRPRLELVEASTQAPVGAANASTKKAVLKKLALPSTGTYRVRVSGLDESTGSYKLTTKGVVPAALKKPSSQPSSGAVETLFDAKPETQLSVIVKAAKGSETLPGVPLLVGPTGAVDLTPFAKFNKSGTRLAIKKALLPAFGSYVLRTVAVTGGDAVGFGVLVKLRPPKIKKTVHVEVATPQPHGGALYSIVLDPSVATAPPTDQADFFIFGGVLPISATELPAQIDWTVAGQGVASGSIAVIGDGLWGGTVPLTPGNNTVTLGIGDDVALRTFDVIYNPGYAFGGNLDLFPDVSYVYPPIWGPTPGRLITARVFLDDPGTLTDLVILVRLEDDGSETLIGTLADDGLLVTLIDPVGGEVVTGDDLAGDGIYTLGFLRHPEAVAIERYRVEVSTLSGGLALSGEATVYAAEYPDTDAWELRAVDQGVMEQQLAEAAAAGTLESLLDQFQAELEGDPSVDSVGRSGNGNGLWMLYADGTAGVISSPGDLIKGGGAASSGQKPAAPVLAADDPTGPIAPQAASPRREPRGVSRSLHADDRERLLQPRLRAYQGHALPRGSWTRSLSVNAGASPQPGTWPSSIKAFAADAPNAVQSGRVLLLAAWYHGWGEGDDIPALAEFLEGETNLDVGYVKFDAAGEGDIEIFKSLGKYGVFGLSSHGDTFFWDDTQEALEQKPQYKWDVGDGPGGQVVLHTNASAADNAAAYVDDLVTGRLVFWGASLGVTPSFIRTYDTALPNSLIYLSICRGTYNGTMAQAFLEVGAGAYLGYSDYVAVGFCRTASENFWNEMIELGATVDDAYSMSCETDADPACFLRFGAPDLELRPQGLLDPSFEMPFASSPWNPGGDPQYWCSLDDYPYGGCGDAGLINFWGPFKPTEGKQMLFMRHHFIGLPFEYVDPDTGPSWFTATGAGSNTFELSPTLKKITFDWNYIWVCDGPPINQEICLYGIPCFALLDVRIDYSGGNLGVSGLEPTNEDPCDFPSTVQVGGLVATGWRTSTWTWYSNIPPFDLVSVDVRSDIVIDDAPIGPADLIVLIDNIRIE